MSGEPYVYSFQMHDRAFSHGREMYEHVVDAELRAARTDLLAEFDRRQTKTSGRVLEALLGPEDDA